MGLCLASFALLIEGILLAFTISTALHNAGEAFAAAFFVFVGGFLAAVGFWIAHVGDPGIGRRFVHDVVGNLSTLRNLSAVVALLRTPMGLAFATAVVGIPLMFVGRRGSGVTGMMAVTVFSIADPALNLFRRPWWRGAFVSAGTWMLLLVVFAAIANGIEPMHEGAMIFLVPVMVDSFALGLSAVVRFVMWASTAGIPRVNREQ